MQSEVGRNEGREKQGICHISCQSTYTELLPAFVLLYSNCPLHIITFLKLFPGELKTFFTKQNSIQK